MKQLKWFVLLAFVLVVPESVRAQVTGSELSGMTVTATVAADGSGTTVGDGTGTLAILGGGVYEARTPRTVVQYCDAPTPCVPNFMGGFGYAPFDMAPGTWTASYSSGFGITRLLFDASGSSAVFTGSANWLGQPGSPVVNYGTFSFLSAVTGGFSQMQIDFDSPLTGEAPFAAGLASAGQGCTSNCQSVPEPGTYLLMFTGLLGMGLVYRRRQMA